MIDFKKYNLNENDIEFISQLKNDCITCQSEVTLSYNGKSFVLEPRGKAIHVYAYGKDLGDFKDFEDLLLNYKIDEKPLIEIISKLDYDE